MITIYQIRLSDSEISRANREGFDAVPTVSAKYNMMFGVGKWKNEYASLYTPSYEVDTDSLDEAFEATNLWEGYDHLVTRFRRGSSSSVGDIFVKDGNCYIVDNFGFANIGKYDLGV